MTIRSPEQFYAFKERIAGAFMQHPVITDNVFCRFFAQGDLPEGLVQHFVVQFSVFSNLFLIAQLKKMINAGTLNEMRAAKEILANEIGCIFNPLKKESADSLQKRRNNPEAEGDPSYVNTEGSVDGGVFKFKAAHFEWLLHMGEKLGLTFEQMGKRRHGSKSTLFFCDELERLYGSEDFSTGAGASFAVEHWAAAGFWGELIQGLKIFKKNKVPDLPLGFFTWHDKVEAQHAQHTSAELEELYFGSQDFDEDRFIAAGKEMLEGVHAFWLGLEADRRAQIYAGKSTKI